MRKLSVPFVLAAALAAAAPAYANHKFPLQEGNKWTHKNLKFGGVSGMAVAQEYYGMFRLEGFPGGGDDFWVAWGGSTLYAWNWQTSEWKPFLRFGAPAGTKYKINLGTTFYNNVEVTVAQHNLSFTDEHIRQTFAYCTLFQFGPVPGLYDAGIGSLVFAPNVGLVSTSEMTIAGPAARVLESAYVNGRKYGKIGHSKVDSGPTTQYPGTKKVILINTQSQWESFYAQHSPGTTPPAVNFAKNSVVVALAGPRNTGGYSVDVQLARWRTPYPGARIFVRENKPGAGVLVTQAFTQPWQAVVLEEKVTTITYAWEVVEYSNPQ